MRRLFNTQDRNLAINMTPMVDVTFLLLTFCMLTTRFATSEKVNVDLPSPNDNQAVERRFKDKIIINLRYAGEPAKAELQLGPVKVGSVEDLSQRLDELAGQNPNAQVILRADRRLPYREVRRVMEAVAGAKLTHLQVVTEVEQETMTPQWPADYPDARADLDRTDDLIAAARSRSSARTLVPFSVRYQQRRQGFGGVMLLNMTPMLDVLFLLLFFFMAAASRFLGNEGMLPAQLPAQRAAAVAEIPRTPIRIRFQQSKTASDVYECKVTIDRFHESPALPIAELAGALKKIQESQPGFDAGAPVHLMAGEDVRWDYVVNAYNAALAARYEKVFFATPR